MKKILFAVLVSSLVLVIIGLSRSIYDLWNKQDLLISYKKQLSSAQNENKVLKSRLAQANNPNFLEEQARDNLFLVKSGEQSVIVPNELLIGTNSAKPIGDNLPNWKKWWNLFF